jgi:hypothetical protein
LLRFTIGNPKYPEGPRSPNGPSGHDPPPPGSNGCLTKIMSTSLSIFVCILTRSVPLEICGLDLILIMVWVDVVVNGALVTIAIEWGIATEYNGIDLVCSHYKKMCPYTSNDFIGF